MKFIALRILLLLLLIPTGISAAEPSPGMNLADRDFSPRSDIIVEHYVNEKTYDREVWLAPAERETDRVLLYKHGRSVEVIFSPDEQWLVVNDFRGSSSAEPYLFKRVSGVTYLEVKEANIWDKVWQLVAKDYPIVRSQDFGHRYLEVLQWAKDSKAFLVKAFGHLDMPDVTRELDDWLCVFTLEGYRATIDLSLMNRGTMRSEGDLGPAGP